MVNIRILSLFNRKSVGKVSEFSTSDLSQAQKADITALRDDGLTPSEISQELGISAEKISRVLELEKRRAARIRGSTAPSSDPVAIAQNQLQSAQARLQAMELQFETKKLEAQIEDYFDDGDDEPEDDPFSMIFKAYAANLLTKGGAVQGVTPSPPAPQTSLEAFSDTNAGQELIDLQDEEINALIEANKKRLFLVQKLPDQMLLKLVKKHFPQYTEKTQIRAVELLKKKEIKVKA